MVKLETPIDLTFSLGRAMSAFQVSVSDVTVSILTSSGFPSALGLVSVKRFFVSGSKATGLHSGNIYEARCSHVTTSFRKFKSPVTGWIIVSVRYTLREEKSSHEVEVEIVGVELLERVLEGNGDQLGLVVRVPELGGLSKTPR
jgi:hypothetical protein